MAKYTITLADLLKTGYNIFDDTWTTFDPEHKRELCSKIIRHYYFYEIGQETADRFKFYLNEHLALIMPYYNQFYQSETLKITPLYNHFIEDNANTARTLGINRATGSMMETVNVKNLANSIRRLSKGTSDTTANEEYTGNEKWKEDRVITEVKTTDQDTTENTTQNVKFTGNIKEVGNEIVKDTVDGTKTDTGTSNTTTSNTRRYSDTPQAQISASDMSIDQQYLTNYTRDNGTSNTTTKNTEKIENVEDKVTDTTKTTDTKNTEDTTKDVKGTLDATEDLTRNDNVTGSRDTTHNKDNTENVTTTGNEQGFSNGKEDEQSTGTHFSTEDTTHKEKENVGRTTKGFTVSQSELLEAYRRTFINIDAMIIRELATDFMGIF